MSYHCEDSFLLNSGISQSSEKKSTTTENIKQKEVRPPCFSPCRFFHANLVRLLFLVTRPSRKNKPTKTKLSASAAVAMLENANAISVAADVGTESGSDNVAVAVAGTGTAGTGTASGSDNVKTPLKRAKARSQQQLGTLKKQKVSFRPLSRASNVTADPPVGSALVNVTSDHSVGSAVVVPRGSASVGIDMVSMMAQAASGIHRIPTNVPGNIMTGQLSVNQKSSSQSGVKVFLASDRNKSSASHFKLESVYVAQSTKVNARNAFGKYEKFSVQLDADVANHMNNIETVMLKKAYDAERKLKRIGQNVSFSEFVEESMHCINDEELSLRITNTGFRTKKLCEDGTYIPMLDEYTIGTSWMFDMDITMNYWNMNDRHGIAVNAHRIYIIEMEDLNDTLGSFY